MQSYVKMGQLHAPRGLYVYRMQRQPEPKPNPEPQGVFDSRFWISGFGFAFWLSCRHTQHRPNNRTRDETHRPQAQSPPPIHLSRGKPQTWGTRHVGFFLHLAHNKPRLWAYRYQKAGADS
jgi:hypothetical protein